MSLQDCIEDVANTVAAISGIRSAPVYVPEDTSVFPFVAVYAGAGEFRTGEPAGLMKYLGSIVVDLHLARKDLPRDVERVMTYHESIPNDILEDTTLGGHCTGSGPLSCSGLIAMSYGGIETIGLRYTLQNVKIQAAFT